MTIKDIAEQAGVSISTVSRVINGKQTKAARKAVQDKIWEIARAGGYTPNASAQALRMGTNTKIHDKSIACVFARTADVKNDAFFSALIRSIEQAAMRFGYMVKYAFSVYDIDNIATKEMIQNHNVDGAVILGRCDYRTLNFLNRYFQKVVYTGLNELDVDCDQVICDGKAITIDIINFLLKNGHRQIGYIGDMWKEKRYLAYRETLRRHGIIFRQELTANSGGTSEAGYQGAQRILSRTRDLTAIFCMNDITAIGAIKGIQSCGLRVPEDISIISIDDIEVAQYMTPMLTTVHVPIQTMGNVAVATLIDRIEGGHALPLKTMLPYQMRYRESCKRQ